jgi:hypothetical protein
MKLRTLAGALALASLCVAGGARADDPRDPAMRNAAERARDSAMVRKLNREQAAYVQQRDARYADEARGSRDWASRENARRTATWRKAVRMCESGHHEYCAR